MARRIPFFVCDSFTDTPFQGNPAGVFFDFEGEVAEEEYRRLCAEIHLESAFVLPVVARDDVGLADFRMRYFTGDAEVPLCGHATVAAVAMLKRAGRIGDAVRVLTGAGVLPCKVNADGSVTLYQNPPVFDLNVRMARHSSSGVEPDIDARSVASALGFGGSEMLPGGLPPRVVSTGSPWLLVPVANREAVNTTPHDLKAAARVAERCGALGIYVFTVERDASTGGVAIWSRCYAPGAGLDEDPVTGSASGALGGYLAKCGILDVPPGGSASLVAHQGFGGGRGGTARVTVRRNADGAFGRVEVTGSALFLAEGAFAL
jgi:PhzF family phenazine biosynthesis protein